MKIEHSHNTKNRLRPKIVYDLYKRKLLYGQYSAFHVLTHKIHTKLLIILIFVNILLAQTSASTSLLTFEYNTWHQPLCRFHNLHPILIISVHILDIFSSSLLS